MAENRSFGAWTSLCEVDTSANIVSLVEFVDKSNSETTRKRQRKSVDLDADEFGFGPGRCGTEVGRTVKKLKKRNDEDSEGSVEKESQRESVLAHLVPLADWKLEVNIPEVSSLGESSSASPCSYERQVPVNGAGYLGSVDAKAAVGGEADNHGGVGGKLRGQDNLVKLGYLYRDVRSRKCFVTKKHKGDILKSYERNAVTEKTLRLNARLKKSMGKVAMVNSFYAVALPGDSDSDNKHPLRQHRTDALPFLAMYSCTHTNPRHSAVHDCESTLWIIVWVICSITLRITDDEELKREIVRAFINVLLPVSWQVEGSTDRKGLLAGALTSCFFESLMPISFHAFNPAIRELAALVLAYHRKSKEYHGMGRTFTQNQVAVCLKSYIKVIEENMPKETSWDYITTGVVETGYEDSDEGFHIADE